MDIISEHLLMLSKSSKRYMIVLWHPIFFFCFLVSCQQANLDRSYLEASPCKAPCWQNITPGVTDESSAMILLTNPDLIILDSVKCQRDSENNKINGCLFRRISEEGGQISFHDGIVQGLTLKTHYLTLGEVIETLGQPEYLIDIQGSQIVSEGKCYRAGLFYSEGIYFNISGCEPIDSERELIHDGNLLFFEEMQIINVNFYEPSNSLEKSLLNLSNSFGVDSKIEALKPWDEYGYYSLVD